ncbi:MAG: YbdK family carboxylate-amine ligase [Flavobacteriales bacterium]
MTYHEPLHFQGNARAFTLGVELELQVLDAATLRLTPQAPLLLERLADPRLAKEMYQSTIELITGVCGDAKEACTDLGRTFSRLTTLAHGLGLRFAGTGTNPVANYNDRVLSPVPRYHELLDRNQWLIRRMAVYGLHIHIGMISGDACIRFMNQFLHVVPHLIALAASSPFWHGLDTGLVASRPTVYEAHPTAGIPPPVHDWYQFQKLHSALLRTGSIQSMKDIWWDIRPSPGFGTLELRMCDGPASLAEVGAIVAFAHAQAHLFQEEQDRFNGTSARPPKRWIARENKWRALRYGLDAQLIDHRTLEQRSLRADILERLEHMAPFFKAHGYDEQMACLRTICARGNSSQRQRKAHEQRGSLDDVLAHNARECEAREPIWV